MLSSPPEQSPNALVCFGCEVISLTANDIFLAEKRAAAENPHARAVSHNYCTHHPGRPPTQLQHKASLQVRKQIKDWVASKSNMRFNRCVTPDHKVCLIDTGYQL